MSGCLAIDPGKRAGWALYYEGCIKRSGVVNGDETEKILNVLKKYSFVKTLVIEDQFIATTITHKGQRKPRNPKGIKTLLYRRYLWEILAKLRGMEIVVVNPATWQAYYMLKRGDKEGIKKLARIFRGQEVEDDEADAVLVAQWWAYVWRNC